MGTQYKVLGQVAPTGTANVDLYTVPADTSTVVSTLNIANLTAEAATFSVYIRVAGAAAASANTLLKDVPLAANSLFSATQGITLGAADVITVSTGTADALSFQLFGSEIS
jgi:hypothetical protein